MLSRFAGFADVVGAFDRAVGGVIVICFFNGVLFVIDALDEVAPFVKSVAVAVFFVNDFLDLHGTQRLPQENSRRTNQIWAGSPKEDFVEA